ncbi:MAG: hypothetical protein QXU88_01100 [Candidatus Woesearchaeota archaeon]
MEPKSALSRLEASPQLRNWRQAHTDSFLVHAFVMLDEANKDIVQFGFFDPKKGSITTFMVTPEEIYLLPESEILKTGSSILPLKMSEVRLDAKKVISLAEEYLKRHHPREQPIKSFYILQRLDIGCVFNITYVTASFKILNIKMSASTGKILRHSFESLVDLG